jgi:hypothetical protein
MTEPPEAQSAPCSPPRPAGAALAAIAPWVQLALAGLGVASAATELRPGRDALLGAVVRLGLFLLAGWVARRLLGAGAAALDLFATASRSLDRLASSTAGSTLQRPQTIAAELPPADLKTLAEQEIRQAIRDSQWAEVETRITAFSRVHADPDAAEGLARELAAAKEAATTFLRARIEAARSAADPKQVVEARGALVPLLRPDALRELDHELARWLMNVIQKRLRGGVMTPDVAALAGRAVETFPATPEGASLRAALPTLRRSAGLCARCGQPFTGIADACPACLAHRAEPMAVVPALPPDDDDPSEPLAPIDPGFM